MTTPIRPTPSKRPSAVQNRLLRHSPGLYAPDLTRSPAIFWQMLLHQITRTMVQVNKRSAGCYGRAQLSVQRPSFENYERGVGIFMNCEPIPVPAILGGLRHLTASIGGLPHLMGSIGSHRHLTAPIGSLRQLTGSIGSHRHLTVPIGSLRQLTGSIGGLRQLTAPMGGLRHLTGSNGGHHCLTASTESPDGLNHYRHKSLRQGVSLDGRSEL
jgi:hypothetical protein